MNTYEALFIFPDHLKDEALDATVNKVRQEIEKSGGKVESTTRMGRRAFARPMQKQTAGHYMVIAFKFDGEKLRALQGRFKLIEEIFRVQFIRLPEQQPVAAGAEEKK
jgi:ribosomal protein S6